MTEQAPPRGDGDGFVVIDRAYELAREMTRRVRALPRDLRFVLGDRLLTGVPALSRPSSPFYGSAKGAAESPDRLLVVPTASGRPNSNPAGARLVASRERRPPATK
jgi:hypothetical protein